MNRIEFVDIEIKDLEKRCLAALRENGATDEEAAIVFADYLDAEVRGRLSHGFIAFDVALAAFPTAQEPEIVAHATPVIAMDGHGGSGHVAARKAIDVALDDVQNRGLCVIGIRDIARFNCPGSIARYAAERGAIALVLEYGGKNFMVPHGGVTASLSTNPIGVAVPGADPLFVLDIATSERALGYVTLAKLANDAIPSTWGVDADGNPTTDPNALAAVSPFGGYKGYGLALAVEILAGALVGVPIGAKGDLAHRGALIVLLSPSVFGQTTTEFEGAVREFLSDVIGTPAADPSRPVRYPGQAADSAWVEAREAGRIRMPRASWERLEEITSASAAHA